MGKASEIKGWTADEIDAIRDNALHQTSERLEVLKLLQSVTNDQFWVSYRFAQFSQTRITTVAEWVAEHGNVN